MRFKEIIKNKTKYSDLLFEADEQISMIEKYLYKGRMYALYDGGLKAVCVVQDMGRGVLEIKNLAVCAGSRNKGYGKAFLAFIQRIYAGEFAVLQVGTGEPTVKFYEKCGFEKSHVVKNFFTDNYDHTIIDCGVRLTDMIYLKKRI